MIFLILIATLFFVSYIYLTWNNDYWRKKAIPYQKPFLIFGNITPVLMGREHLGILIWKSYKKFSSHPFVGMFRFNTPFVLIRDPDIIQKILVSDHHNFGSNDFEVDPKVDPVMACNPFGHIGEHWKTTRSRWAAAVTPGKLKAAHDTMLLRSEALIKSLRKQINVPIEAGDMSSTFFVDVVVSSIFGVDLKMSEFAENPFTKIARSLFIPTFQEALNTFIFMTMPFLQKLLGLTMVTKETKSILLAITKEIVLNCEGSNFIKKEDAERFKTTLQPNHVKSHSDYEIPGMVFGYLLEGTQTSSILMSFALFELASSPQIQGRLRKELEDAAARNAGKIPYEELLQLPYLDMILSETLRLYPPGLTLSRKSTCPYTLRSPDGHLEVDLPPGTPVTIPLYGLHMDPQHFPQPQTFDPERFTPEAVAQRHEYVYMPFGKGPRTCFGNRLAMVQTKVGLSSIVRELEVRVHCKTSAKPLQVNPNSLIYKPVGGLWLTFHALDQQ